jgi:hypothetical protein
VEDFSPDIRDAVAKIGYSVNSFADDISQAFNKGINDDNINQQTRIIDVKVDASGTPSVSSAMKHSLTSISGLQVIKVVNTKNSSAYPSGTPFLSYTEKGNIIEIVNITNLSPNYTYRLTVKIFG